MLPDGATLLRFEVRPFLAFEVFCKLRQVGKGDVHPPRSRGVAVHVLGRSYQVNSLDEGWIYLGLTVGLSRTLG